MTSPLVFAMSFAVWRCRDCRMEVAWEDACCELEDGKLVAVRCEECAE